MNDPGLYMPRERLEFYKSHDPIAVLRTFLLDKAGLAEQEVEALATSVEARMEAAVEFARTSPEPSVEEFLESIEP